MKYRIKLLEINMISFLEKRLLGLFFQNMMHYTLFFVFDEELHEEILVKAEKKRLSMREGTHLKSKC